MRFLLFSLLFVAPILRAATIEELNQEAEQALRAASPDTHKILRRKVVDQWRLAESAIEEFMVALEDANYVVKIDSDCSQYADRLKNDATFLSRVRTQIKNSVEFLADAHARLMGNTSSIFSIGEVAICTDPINYETPRLNYDRFLSKLRVRIGPRLRTASVIPSLRNNLTLLAGSEIRKLWNSGEHLKAEEFSIRDVIARRKNPIIKYWPFLDPIGEVRTALREVIRREAMKRSLSIGSNDPISILTAAKKMLSTHLQAKLDTHLVNPDHASRVLESWKEQLTSPVAAEEMITASLAAIGQQMAQDGDVEKTQVGLVNVENFHQIGVSLDVSLTGGNVEAYQKQVQVPVTLKTRIKQYGLVNVSTADQVHVTVGMLLTPGTFERATLANALDVQ